MIALIGTSGFQYPAWRGTFYPEKFPPAKMLSFYAERFLTTEINYTFYRIPNGKTMGAWDSATPEHFRFGLKAPQKVTHIAKLRNCEELMGIFQRVVLGLGSKLGPVLFQLPPNFKKDAQLLKDFLATLSSGIRVAFEFRHVSWLDDEIFALLRDHKAALCIAKRAISRFRRWRRPILAICACGGKTTNRKTSCGGRNSFRRKRKTWSHAFVFFKHEESGTGPRLANQLMKELAVAIG